MTTELLIIINPQHLQFLLQDRRIDSENVKPWICGQLDDPEVLRAIHEAIEIAFESFPGESAAENPARLTGRGEGNACPAITRGDYEGDRGEDEGGRRTGQGEGKASVALCPAIADGERASDRSEAGGHRMTTTTSSVPAGANVNQRTPDIRRHLQGVETRAGAGHGRSR